NGVAGQDPTNLAEFTTFPRYLVPDSGAGVTAVFNDLAHKWGFSTGTSNGDGSQASHWKRDEITGVVLRIMDPTLASGVIQHITPADIRALDVIGWDLSVPEPATFAFVGLALAIGGFAAKRRRAA